MMRWSFRPRWSVGLALSLAIHLTFINPAGALAADDGEAAVAAGQRIYQNAQLPSGQPLSGQRPMGRVTGLDAACVNCHRPSGLGGMEGHVAVTPITGRALFGGARPQDQPVVVRLDRLNEPAVSMPHAPYDEAALAKAIRQGVLPGGRVLDPLMPRFDLNDDEIRALSEYLKTLSPTWSPGVSEQEIHLATVIAPGMAAERRQAFIDTLQALVSQISVNNIDGLRKKIPVVERRLHSRRKWVLDIWELSGPSQTWQQQLLARHAERPVFAVLSGLGGGEWQPVHDFCEQQKVVCWFPSIDASPQGAEHGHYSVYFSRGVLLEADVLAQRWQTEAARPRQVLQILSADPAAKQAAQALAVQLDRAGIAHQELAVSDVPTAALPAQLSSLVATDAVVAWLRPADLHQLSTLKAPKAPVFFSATLGGRETDLTGSTTLQAAWRQQAWLIQPMEAPKMRQANLERFNTWLKARKHGLVDERLQAEIYYAANSLAAMLNGMLNNLHTGYLIERAESTLSMREAMDVQEEIQAMMMGGMAKHPASAPQTLPTDSPQSHAEHPVDLQELMKRRGTTAYPRLSLAPGQRIASKGAYIEALAPAEQAGEPLWVVPQQP